MCRGRKITRIMEKKVKEVKLTNKSKIKYLSDSLQWINLSLNHKVVNNFSF